MTFNDTTVISLKSYIYSLQQQESYYQCVNFRNSDSCRLKLRSTTKFFNEIFLQCDLLQINLHTPKMETKPFKPLFIRSIMFIVAKLINFLFFTKINNILITGKF